MSEPKRRVLTENIAKTEAWWSHQPSDAIETVKRVAVIMGIPVSLLGKNYDALNLLRAMTAAISLTNWLAPRLRRKLKHKVPQSHLQILHSMILIIYLLTPFTMTHSIHLFQGFRIIQTRMMVLAVIHGLRPNQKLKSILEGCTDLTYLWGSTLHTHSLFSRPFFQSQSVYLRFTHITNMQPKFYMGSAIHHTLDRECSRSRKYLQLTNERLVQAELALRYWREHDNLYIWAPIPIYTERADYRSLEMAIIQEWQPRLNYPFICQFFHPRKGILKKPALNTNAQFGLATLWRRAKHKFTPKLVRQILTSTRFQNRLEPSSTPSGQIQRPGSNKPRCYDPMMEDLPFAMLFAAWPTTFRSLFALSLSLWMLSMLPSNGGMENRLLVPLHSGPMVPHSKPPTTSQTVSTKVASTSSCPSSSMPYTILQDGFHQTCSCPRTTLQSQAGNRWLVHLTTGRMLLQKLGSFQNCGS